MDMVCASLAFIDGLGGPEMMLIFVLVLVLFGGQKLPEFARGLGKSIREFKKAAAGVEEEFKRALEEDERKQAIAKLPAPAATTTAATTAATDAAGPAADAYHSDEYHNAEYHNDPYHTDDPSGGHGETQPGVSTPASVAPAPSSAPAAGSGGTPPVAPDTAVSQAASSTAEQRPIPAQPTSAPAIPLPPPAKTDGS
jgi:TatA/E family protein of Tat protein translocase